MASDMAYDINMAEEYVKEIGDPSLLIHQAKLAEQAERYEDMKAAMVKYVRDTNDDLKTEERNLLSVAFKNLVGVQRSSHRVLTTILDKETTERKKELIKVMARKVLDTLKKYCNEMLELLDGGENSLCGRAKDGSADMVFYKKMKGDYYRYLAEVANEDDPGRDDIIAKSETAYKAACDTAKENLKKTDPILLGLALNFSVFYYEIKLDREKACKLAKEAFDEAISELDSVEESNYKDSTLIMQLLRDNLTLWKSDEEQNLEPQDED